MLNIHIPESEFFDDSKYEFIKTKESDLCLEHSLVSISKWESKWKKPFITKNPHTSEELIDYIKYMTLTQNVDENVYLTIKTDPKLLKKINDYIDDKMTATIFSENKTANGMPVHKSNGGKIITSELIYYWMFSYQIPIECQKWHLNRLLTLIRIFNIEQGNGKKMSKRDTLANNKALNAARRQRLNSRG